MNLYDKIRSEECEIAETFVISIRQILELIDNSRENYDLAWEAFKFGYMQGQRTAECRTNKADEKRTESESDQLRRHICEMAGRIRSERRLRNIYIPQHTGHSSMMDWRDWMSVRIKVSYTDELELARLQQKLAPGIERCRLPREQKGEHKRAYIDWNSNITNPNSNVTK